ncbi:MAG: VOC family protein [Clostridiales bacterium]|nr:VOC family protein [Candidatus Blautia equi]
MITDIAHIAMNPLDMDKSIKFYTEVLGFKKVFELPHEDGTPWIIYLKINKGHFLEMFYGGTLDRDYAYDPKKVGYYHLCIDCGDIKAKAQELFEKGVLEAPVTGFERDKNPNLWIHDPDGNAIEFVEYQPDCIHFEELGTQGYELGGENYKGIAHAAFVVKDIDASMDFYCNHLGFKHIYTLNDENGNPWLNFLQVRPGVYLELFLNGEGENPASWTARGFTHVCLETDDLIGEVERLRAEGIEIDDEPKTSADKNWQAWIHDPDGNMIELMMIDPESPQALA